VNPFESPSMVASVDDLKWLVSQKNGFNSLDEMVFRASADGGNKWAIRNSNPEDDGINHKGPTVTLVKTTDGYVFGGYTAVSWGNGDGNRLTKKEDATAYLFQLSGPDGRSRQLLPVKEGEEEYAVWHKHENGPMFGGSDRHGDPTHDLMLHANCRWNDQNYALLGNSYPTREGGDGDPTFLSAEQTFRCAEWELWTVSQEEPEKCWLVDCVSNILASSDEVGNCDADTGKCTNESALEDDELGCTDIQDKAQCQGSDECVWTGSKCVEGFEDFDGYKRVCGQMRDSATNCKRCGAKWKKTGGKCKAVKKTKQVKCKKISSAKICAMAGCGTKTKNGKTKCSGKHTL